MRVIIENGAPEVGLWSADYIIKRINEKNAKGETFVLGLPTGATPLPTYSELVRRHKAGEVSFKNVVTFNMDEYYGIPSSHPESFQRYMYDNFFDLIDIPRENIHFLNGMCEDPEAECANYERMIAEAGGIDLFLGGVGTDGHIAYNEPFSALNSRTRLRQLKAENTPIGSKHFKDASEVPTHALTVGVGTMMDSREVMILATGRKKAPAMAHAIELPYTHMWPVSSLQTHPGAILVVDEDAVSDITVATYRYFKNLEKENLVSNKK